MENKSKYLSCFFGSGSSDQKARRHISPSPSTRANFRQIFPALAFHFPVFFAFNHFLPLYLFNFNPNSFIYSLSNQTFSWCVLFSLFRMKIVVDLISMKLGKIVPLKYFKHLDGGLLRYFQCY